MVKCGYELKEFFLLINLSYVYFAEQRVMGNSKSSVQVGLRVPKKECSEFLKQREVN